MLFVITNILSELNYNMFYVYIKNYYYFLLFSLMFSSEIRKIYKKKVDICLM